MSEGFGHSFDRDATTVHTKGHCGVFMTSDTLDQGVLDTGVPQVIDHCVAETVEGFLRIADTHFDSVTTKPF